VLTLLALLGFTSTKVQILTPEARAGILHCRLQTWKHAVKQVDAAMILFTRPLASFTKTPMQLATLIASAYMFFAFAGGMFLPLNANPSNRCSLASLVQKYLLTGTKVQILTPDWHVPVVECQPFQQRWQERVSPPSRAPDRPRGAHSFYWYKSTCLLVTKVQVLTPEEFSRRASLVVLKQAPLQQSCNRATELQQLWVFHRSILRWMAAKLAGAHSLHGYKWTCLLVHKYKY
jgi:hypothetical protein